MREPYWLLSKANTRSYAISDRDKELSENRTNVYVSLVVRVINEVDSFRETVNEICYSVLDNICNEAKRVTEDERSEGF